jgi:hypothetical protein
MASRISSARVRRDSILCSLTLTRTPGPATRT